MSAPYGLRVFVEGTPRTAKSGSQTPGLKEWTSALRAALGGREETTAPCHAHIAFRLPRDHFQKENAQNPHGPDLDNLTEPVLDALGETILRPAGGDGAVLRLLVTKRSVRGKERPGVVIMVKAVRTRRRAPP